MSRGLPVELPWPPRTVLAVVARDGLTYPCALACRHAEIRRDRNRTAWALLRSASTGPGEGG